MSEVSASIAETNRVRASMGLAPLAVENPAEAAAAASNARAAQAAAAERAQVESIRAELARRKEKRLVAARVAGQSLGESLVSQTAGSARDWIERSRRLGLSEQARDAAQAAERAAQEAARIHADAYTSNDLSGVKVAHAAGDFARGNEVILTLKDSRLLTGVADDLNDAEDELLSTELAEAARLKENLARRAGAKGASSKRYDMYGEEEAELLSKYSDAVEGASLRLGAAGSLSAADLDVQANSALYAQDEARQQLNQLVYSLDDTVGGEKERKFQSDFKEVKFKKKKKINEQTTAAAAATGAAAGGSDAAAASAGVVGAAIKKKSSSRRPAKAPSASLLDFLAEPSESDRAADLSSRSGKSAQQLRLEAEERVAKEEKDARYLRAIQNAEAKTAQRNALDRAEQSDVDMKAQAHAATGAMVPPPPSSAPPPSAFQQGAASATAAGFVPPPPPPPPGPPPAVAAAAPLAPPPGLFEEEEDELLAQSLARARRLAAQHKTKREDASNGHGGASSDSVRALADALKSRREEDEVRVKQEPMDDAATAAAATAGGPSSTAARSAPPGMKVKAETDGVIIFSATTEFVRGLQFEQEERRVKRENGAASTAAAAASAAAASAAAGPAAMDIDGEEKKSSSSSSSSRVVSADGSVSIADGAADSDAEGGDQGSESGSGSDDSDSDSDGGLRSDEPYAATGMAAALQLFKNRGILKEGGNGRGDAGDKFNLERYDAFGKEQSKKEQFRSLSHRFHGIEPGLKKQEKRLKKVQEEAQRLQAFRETGGVTSKIVEKQKQLGSAHVVLDKKLTAALATGAAGGGDDAQAAQRRTKHAGPFAQFGFGKGNFKKRKAAQEADASAKKAHKSAEEM